MSREFDPVASTAKSDGARESPQPRSPDGSARCGGPGWIRFNFASALHKLTACATCPEGLVLERLGPCRGLVLKLAIARGGSGVVIQGAGPRFARARFSECLVSDIESIGALFRQGLFARYRFLSQSRSFDRQAVRSATVRGSHRIKLKSLPADSMGFHLEGSEAERDSRRSEQHRE